MANDVSIEMPNIDQIRKRIKHVATAEVTALSRKATRDMGNILKKEMQRRVPSETGAARRGIKVSVRKAKKFKGWYARVGYGRKVNKTDLFYVNILEGGADPHRIPNKTIGRGRNKRENDISKRPTFGGKSYTSVNHPGIRARKFVRATYVTKRRAAIAKGSSTMLKGIQKALDK